MTDLRIYLELLKKTKDLKTIKKSVSLKYEIAAITAKADGSHAIIFDKLKEKKSELFFHCLLMPAKAKEVTLDYSENSPVSRSQWLDRQSLSRFPVGRYFLQRGAGSGKKTAGYRSSQIG